MSIEKNTLPLSTGDKEATRFASDLRRDLNTLLSLALAPNGLDLDQNELQALRNVSDLMLQLHRFDTSHTKPEAKP
jgi:hypothetical protein